MNQAAYHVRLLPKEQSTRLKLGELWRYRDLVLLLTKKTFTMTYQQTILGPLWILLNPVLSSLIYMFIFGHIAEIGTGGVPQILFYFVSSAVWSVFATSLTDNAGTFISNAYLFSKVYFPRLAVPVSNMLVSILKFLVQFGIVLVLIIVYTVRGDITPVWAMWPLLPLLLLEAAMLGMSAGVLLSGLTTKYRDLMHVVRIIVSLWMYGSAVVYPLSELREGTMKTLIRLNPMTGIMELVRRILLGTGEFHAAEFAAGIVITVLLFVAGTLLFNKVERTFADTV